MCECATFTADKKIKPKMQNWQKKCGKPCEIDNKQENSTMKMKRQK